MILVVGSTGYLGSEICRRLAAAGRPVRGLVRSTSAPEKVANLKALGVETVQGDLQNPASLLAACQGIETVITTASATTSFQPSDSIPATDGQGQLNLVAAARQAGVSRFIYTSIYAGSSACPLTTAKRSVEAAVQSSGMVYTILQPALFMEAWLTPVTGFDRAHARATIYGDGHARNGYISLGDVARYAVESLDKPAARNAVFEIAHPQACSPLEAVRLCEQAGGKSFELQFVPAAALQAQAAAATDPLQASFATLMGDMARGIRLDTRAAQAAFSFPLVSVAEFCNQG